ncbi:MAG: tRNA-guanine transglycosylase, partial [Chloroflexi bacterium]|nr:tRNA-guanine transglycosylase [Chloroflexota bacterium]
SDYDYIKAAMRRTHLWAKRCQQAHTRADQALFGIVQGGIFPDLRSESVKVLTDMEFPGYAIGGLSVGESKEQMYGILEHTTAQLPALKARYLMGVGSPEDLVEGVARGVDIFDCVLPTRLARTGAVFCPDGRLNLRNAAYKEDPNPIQDGCSCYACRTFSRAYLRHLVMSDEILGLRLNTIHNVHFLLELTRDMRVAIAAGTFATFRRDFMARYRVADAELRAEGHRTWHLGKTSRLLSADEVS